MNSRARIQTRLGQTQRFIGELDVFLLAFNQLLVLLQIRVGLLNFQLNLSNVVVVSDLGFRKEGALLYDLASDQAAVPDRQTALDLGDPTF